MLAFVCGNGERDRPQRDRPRFRAMSDSTGQYNYGESSRRVAGLLNGHLRKQIKYGSTMHQAIA